MNLLFLDESGTPPSLEKAEGRVFVLAGVAINVSELQALELEFRGIKNKYQIFGEVKWKYFSHSSKLPDNSFSHISSRPLFESTIFSQDFYDLNPLSNPEALYHCSYEAIYYQFDAFLQKEKSFGMINIDNQMNFDNKQLRSKHHSLLKHSLSTLIVNTLTFVESELSEALKLADLVAGAVYRANKYGDSFFTKKLRFIEKTPSHLREGAS